MTFTPQMLIDQIRVQQEEDNADILLGREIEQENLDILDADASTVQ